MEPGPSVKKAQAKKKTPKFREREGEVAQSKMISWLLRHGAQDQGLAMRPDGYVRVNDLLACQQLRSVDFQALQEIVKKDNKKRYTLLFGSDGNTDETGIWWIRANQGHTIKSVKLELQQITSTTEIPMAVHGTNRRAWESIEKQGLSRMKRNHIHLAQGVAGDNVISGMRRSSQILIFIDVQKALDAGIQFFLSDNGVVLTAGNEHGFLAPEFFKRVESIQRVALPGWDGPRDSAASTVTQLEGKPIVGEVVGEASAPLTRELTPTTDVAAGLTSKNDITHVTQRLEDIGLSK